MCGEPNIFSTCFDNSADGEWDHHVLSTNSKTRFTLFMFCMFSLDRSILKNQITRDFPNLRMQRDMKQCCNQEKCCTYPCIGMSSKIILKIYLIFEHNDFFSEQKPFKWLKHILQVAPVWIIDWRWNHDIRNFLVQGKSKTRLKSVDTPS